MRPLPILFAALFVAAPGCASVPGPGPSGAAPDARTIAWIKGVEGRAFRDQHGVCRMHARDMHEALQSLGEQVKACFEGTLPAGVASAPAAKSIKVAWNRVRRERLDALYSETTGRNALYATRLPYKRALPLFSVRGFFVQVGDTCHVVVPEGSDYVRTLGHEFKHCVDGLYHDEHGAWLKAQEK